MFLMVLTPKYMRLILIIIPIALMISASGQKTSFDFTFTAVDNGKYIRLDSIKVMNRTQGDSVKLYWPDTTLTYQIIPGDILLYVGYAMDFPVGMWHISDRMKEFRLFYCYPNPVIDQSIISVYLPSKGTVNIMVSEVSGKTVVNLDRELEEGTHSFRFLPGDNGIYFLRARYDGITKSIKIISKMPTGGKTCKIEYLGLDNNNPSLKQSQLKAGLVVQESGILDTPTCDTTYTFQFATNIPCPETPTVTYAGQVYNTIQIYSQCWLKENLNVGTMISGNQVQTNNGIIEKYCNNNEADSCTKYGGLYQWDEMMQYMNQQGAQGICPPGWHLPTDEEWKVLEGAVDTHFRIGDPEWDLALFPRGYDAGSNLKSTSVWQGNGVCTDLFGFSALPGGVRLGDGYFHAIGYTSNLWTSSGYNVETAWYRCLYGWQGLERNYILFKESGFSVRCLKSY